jgi:hypothetical protein
MPCFWSLWRASSSSLEVGEVGQHDAADARLQHEGVAHRLGRDLGARDGQLDRLGEPDAANADGDLAALGPAELADDLVGRDVVLELLVADVRDDVTGADPHLVGRGPLHR